MSIGARRRSTASRYRGGGGGTPPPPTGVTASHLLTDFSTTDGTVFTTVSVTPTASNLQLLFIAVSTSSTAPTSLTVTGAGLTWVQHQVTGGSTQRNLFMFRALGASPSAGALTITSGVTLTGCSWSLTQFTGMDATGTNGSGALVSGQTAEDHLSGGDNTTMNVSLASAPNSANATFAGIHINSNSVITSGVNWQDQGAVAHTSPAGYTLTAFGRPPQQVFDTSWAAGSNTWGIVTEIKAA
jgi:hypothetical protein